MMRRKSMSLKDGADLSVRDIRRRTRKHRCAEERIRFVIAGLRGEEPIATLCSREGIVESQYCSWLKEFLETGRKRPPHEWSQAKMKFGVMFMERFMLA